jgi:hypothetical protein
MFDRGVSATAAAFRSHGTAASISDGDRGAAPQSSIYTGLGSIADDTATLRRNGAVLATSATDQGTGNYSNSVLYLFSRAGTSLPFSGFCYDLAVVGKLATSGEIAACEAQMNTAMGIY